MAVRDVTPADYAALEEFGQSVDAVDSTWRSSIGTPPLTAAELEMYCPNPNLGCIMVTRSPQSRIVGYAVYHATSGRIGWLVYDPQFVSRVQELVNEILARTGACWGLVASQISRDRLAQAGYIVGDPVYGPTLVRHPDGRWPA